MISECTNKADDEVFKVFFGDLAHFISCRFHLVQQLHCLLAECVTGGWQA